MVTSGINIPTILTDAIPVDAVIPIIISLLLQYLMISLNKTDFPVPADPVKKTF
ncbi:hypothetical protein CYLTODRAFT_353218 [Cylindrobasidium torrendii FP15055 ss-10]|uniref:Uncharacterized protein n=1 Tax=Cylindrobasidium torrendii FP15055 ss-10 TaxID=1314674 RepID=A0A0D7BD07_9AGAR|nr:hypothetical protein CYLTODRAFT_353218 [Cylindrobasidium torrendii FP15055 ss-10]